MFKKVTPLIGIAGMDEVGKDTVANIILKLTNKSELSFVYPYEMVKHVNFLSEWEIKPFSERVKLATAIILGISKEEVFSREFKTNKYTSRNLTGRQIFIEVAHNFGRKVLGEDIWVKNRFNNYNIHKDKWIIPDVRYKNEVEAIKAFGGIVIQVKRPGIKNQSAFLDDNTLFDYTINNSKTLNDLEKLVLNILIKEGILKPDFKLKH